MITTNINADILLVRNTLRGLALLQRLRALERPRPVYYLALLVFWLAAILGAWLLVIHGSLALLPLALLLFASGQRFLGNSLHDASHGNLGLRCNDLLGSWLLAPLMFENLRHYTKLHMEHHRFLGDSKKDPDYLSLPTGCSASACKVYLKVLLSPRRWRDSVLADLPNLSLPQRVAIVGWWAGFHTVLALLDGPSAALWFGGLWLASRSMTYHALKTFTELADHGGLPVGTILSRTRNSPDNFLSLLLHPHHDNFHLTHHLAPGIPMINLRKAHHILLNVPAYRDGHQCDSYFWGHRSVIQSWVAYQSAQHDLHQLAVAHPSGTDDNRQTQAPCD
jgi:fatty acid desaturase